MPTLNVRTSSSWVANPSTHVASEAATSSSVNAREQAALAALPRVGAGRNVALVTGAGLLIMGAVASGFRAAHPMTAIETRLAASGAAMSAAAVGALNRLGSMRRDA